MRIPWHSVGDTKNLKGRTRPKLVYHRNLTRFAGIVLGRVVNVPLFVNGAVHRWSVLPPDSYGHQCSLQGPLLSFIAFFPSERARNVAVQPPSPVPNAVKVALRIGYMGEVGSVCERGDRRNEGPVVTCRVQALAG